MKRYDPDRPPDAREWNKLDELEQQQVVIDYHRRARFKLPNQRLHAVLHVIVENQVMLGDEIPVVATLDRLMREGLSRHDAIHAIGGVLMEFIADVMGNAVQGEINEMYYARIAKLTAAGWLAEFD